MRLLSESKRSAELVALALGDVVEDVDHERHFPWSSKIGVAFTVDQRASPVVCSLKKMTASGGLLARHRDPPGQLLHRDRALLLVVDVEALHDLPGGVSIRHSRERARSMRRRGLVREHQPARRSCTVMHSQRPCRIASTSSADLRSSDSASRTCV